MKLKTRVKAVASALLCASLLLAQQGFATSISDIQNNIDSLEGQVDDIESEKKLLDEQISDTDKKIAEKQKELDSLNAQVAEVEGSIDELNYTIYTCNEKINELQTNISDKEAEIEEDYEILRQRIRTIYVSGGTSDLEVLLGAKSFDEFIDASVLVKALSKHDQKLIDGLRDAITEINSEIDEVEAQQKQLESAKLELEETRESLNSLTLEANAAAQELQALKGDLETEVHQLTDEQQALYTQIEDMMRQKQEEEERIRAEQEAANNPSGGTSGGTSTPPGGTGSSADGYAPYVWPAPTCTVITSYWGDGRNHQGMDFACYGSAYGEPIVAAASGTVSFVNAYDEWGSGWGYYIMIDHGGGYATLYAHCSQIIAYEGQSVSAGELIGYIGNTGNSFGAHLHFECWYYSTRYDPSVHLF